MSWGRLLRRLAAVLWQSARAWWGEPRIGAVDRWRLRLVQDRTDRLIGSGIKGDARAAADEAEARERHLAEIEDFDRRLGVAHGLGASTHRGPDAFDRAGVTPAHDRPATLCDAPSATPAPPPPRATWG